MAGETVTRTRKISRDKLAKLFGGRHELIVAFESLTEDVGEVLPVAVDEAKATAALAKTEAENAKTSADTSLALSEAIAPLIEAMSQLPEVGALLGRIEDLERRLYSIEQGPTP